MRFQRLLRGHVLHPLLIWREPQEELEKPDFWSNYDIPQIVGGATMLDVRNAALGLRQQELQLQQPPSTRLHALPAAQARCWTGAALPSNFRSPPGDLFASGLYGRVDEQKAKLG